ncbi:4-hydroxyacetophenone monooxygenase [Auricularia subglabra TFB-10046 SS5]|nr:4-hydroxyacetophenone monooxygenase [Auricularia subglabra TFB-10046 SS5]
MSSEEFVPVICIGAGLGGICLGIQLQRQLGVTDFHIYEQLHEFGGTWCVQTYPGCACDVPAVLYSFSFAQKPDWTVPFPPQAEILKYIINVADSNGLRERTTFRTKCLGATWDEERKRWRVRLSNLDTDETYTRECRVFISAVGILTEPNPTSLTADFTAFQGPVFHSGRWDHSVDLRDRDVVVIGNGCTASQIVPAIAATTRSLTQITRSPHWIIPSAIVEAPGTGHPVLFKKLPFLQYVLRICFATFLELSFVSFFKNVVGLFLRKVLERLSRKYVLSTAPKRYHDILIPDYDIGCKRRIFDSAFYVKSLQLENVNLLRSDIREVLPHAIRTDAGLHPADVIVLATGYSNKASYVPFPLVGRDGIDIHKHWEDLGGPGAYDTTACSGFPNFFMILGPNSVTGHTSTIIAIENTVNLIMKLVRPVLAGRVESVEVKARDEANFVARVQKALRNTILTGCRSWYITADGWNTGIYPWSQVLFWWRCTFPHRKAWTYST